MRKHVSRLAILLIVVLATARSELRAQSLTSRSLPRELQYTDAFGLTEQEARLAEQLRKGKLADRVAAAEALWRQHNLRYASEIVEFLADASIKDQGYLVLRRYVAKKREPEEVVWELRNNDYAWGAWLAFLGPRPEFVQELLKALDKKDYLPITALALGKSRDQRAFQPLLDLLKADDDYIAGCAAQGLGYFGDVKAERALIDALSRRSWMQVHVCGALAKIGTRRSLPALDEIAKDRRYTGALDLRGAAEEAIAEIQKRDR